VWREWRTATVEERIVDGRLGVRTIATQPRRRLQPEDRRRELLDAGEALVRRHGSGVRISDVVQAAGAAKGTFYVYFPTWDDFLLALGDRAFEALVRDFEAGIAAHRDWRSLIFALPDLFIGLTASLEGLHEAIFHGPVRNAPPEPRHDVIGRLTRRLVAGAGQGALVVADAPLTARFVFGVLHHAADLVEAGQPRAAVAETFGRLLADSLSAREVSIAGG
jgi:AcrR family transcriptional regulator